MTANHAEAILGRLQAAEAETREALRALRYALDDLAAAHETARQLRAELAALLGSDVSADASLPAHALVVEHGACGHPEVTR